MKLQLKTIFSIAGESKPFEYEIEPEKLSGYSGHSFASAIALKGTVFNRAGVVTLSYCYTFSMNHVCDRCLREFVREYSFDQEHTLVSSSGRDDYVVCPDFVLDMDELALSDLLLELPTKILCREDCRGLCFKCGADLNEGECSCCNSDQVINS